MASIDPSVIGHNSRLLRGLAGWSIEEMATMTGISIGTIKNTEQLDIPYSKPFALAIVYVVEKSIKPFHTERFLKLISEKIEVGDDWEFIPQTVVLGPIEVFQTNLRKLRLSYRISQRKLSDISGVSQSKICECERKNRPMSQYTYDLLTMALEKFTKGNAQQTELLDMAKRQVLAGYEPPIFSRVARKESQN